ncbi:hypothetical protein LZ30DRAFT_96829 [Colletotrichum cereale]|nr:hypothetical protein LZ30DRAFT_96829 [Colletotrichum cereale]
MDSDMRARAFFGRPWRLNNVQWHPHPFVVRGPGTQVPRGRRWSLLEGKGTPIQEWRSIRRRYHLGFKIAQRLPSVTTLCWDSPPFGKLQCGAPEHARIEGPGCGTNLYIYIFCTAYPLSITAFSMSVLSLAFASKTPSPRTLCPFSLVLVYRFPQYKGGTRQGVKGGGMGH